ncbi:MAG: hypothetical protein SF053_21275 [Bacteroidia bacterium]|jgi:hypothetical protein|nr:hypothetical protein [Bacteroidia bacterium]
MKRVTISPRTLMMMALVLVLGLSSCRALRGDPRKNCNHPDHGNYMREQRMKKTGF